MITKTIDPSDSGARRRVYEAVGGEFLSRLLLPLRAGRVHPKPLTEDDVNHQVALSTLGLSVMSNLSADEEVASSSAVKQAIPLALLVIQSKGIRKQVCRYTKFENVEIELGVEIRAVVDALNICMNAMRSGLDPVASQTDGNGLFVDAADTVLAWIMNDLLKAIDHSQIDILLDLIESAMKFCHASLLNLLRHSVDDNQEASLKEAIQLIPALSHVFASPSSRCSIIEFSNVAKDSRGKQVLIDAHLGALHSLAMIFSRVETISHDWEAYDLLTSGGKNESWLEDIKVGVEVILTGRMVDRERHMALVLTAAMLELFGSKWLQPADKHGLHFYQVLVQTIRVELGVLLLDAMSPEARVLSSYSVSLFDSSNKLGNAETGKSSMGVSNKGKEPVKVEIPVPREPLPPPGSLVSKVEELEINGSSSRSEEKKATRLTSHSTVSSAGERVMMELPVCLVIFENLIEILAEDDFPSVTLGVPTSSKVKAFEAIMESAEVLLQFIEQRASDVKEKSILLDEQLETLILACWRALARFCAEAPDPLSERIQKIAPVLFDILSDPTQALHCLLPMMVQVIEVIEEDSSNPTRQNLQDSWSQVIATKIVLSVIVQDLIETCRMISCSEEHDYEVMGFWRQIDLVCSLLVGVSLNKSLPASSIQDAWEYWRQIGESPYIFEVLQKILGTAAKINPEYASDDVFFLGEIAAGLLSLLCMVQTFANKNELPLNLRSEEKRNIPIFITMSAEYVVLSGSFAARESIPTPWKKLAQCAAQLAQVDQKFANHVSQKGVPMMEIVNLLD